MHLAQEPKGFWKDPGQCWYAGVTVCHLENRPKPSVTCWLMHEGDLITNMGSKETAFVRFTCAQHMYQVGALRKNPEGCSCEEGTLMCRISDLESPRQRYLPTRV